MRYWLPPRGGLVKCQVTSGIPIETRSAGRSLADAPHSEPHPEEHRASDASRRMAARDGRASRHPSRRPATLRAAKLLKMRSGEFKPIGFIKSVVYSLTARRQNWLRSWRHRLCSGAPSAAGAHGKHRELRKRLETIVGATGRRTSTSGQTRRRRCAPKPSVPKRLAFALAGSSVCRCMWLPSPRVPT